MEIYKNCICFNCEENREENEPDCSCEMSPPSPTDYNCKDCPKKDFCDIALNPKEYE